VVTWLDAQAGDEVAITRHGKVVAVLVHPDALKQVRRFLTNNRRDFAPSIAEIDIVRPDQVPPIG
jgi:antitoxin (DNA-binding transcriptional repressor) of toxin-antitoxin stability system